MAETGTFGPGRDLPDAGGAGGAQGGAGAAGGRQKWVLGFQEGPGRDERRGICARRRGVAEAVARTQTGPGLCLTPRPPMAPEEGGPAPGADGCATSKARCCLGLLGVKQVTVPARRE